MRLVTPPTAAVLTLAEAKGYMLWRHDDQDSTIQLLIDQAVAHIDGWDGILGRCIMPQTWAFDAVAGNVRSPMPNVTTATQDSVPLLTDGTFIAVPADGEVQITCALPERYLPKMKGAVAMITQEWFDNRPAKDMPPAAHAIISSMRWNQI